MDSLHSASEHAASDSEPPDRSRRVRLRTLAVALAAGVLAALVPAGAASADPDSVDEAKEKVERLTNKVEVITEQYNGMRVRLKKVKQATRAAQAAAAKNQQRIEELRKEVRQLAATSYKTGGLSSAAMLAATKSPQQFLDRAATLRRMTVQDANKLRSLRRAIAASRQAAQAAEQRSDRVEELAAKIEGKKQQIEGTLEEAKGKLNELTTRASRSSGGAVGSLPGSGLAVKATNVALNQQGDPYVYGASGPNSFDCSGLVMYAYGQVGINLPHYTGAQYSAGTPVSKNNLAVGDLVFFYSNRHHVGIYIGNGKMVHAPNSTTVVKVSPISGRPYNGAVRIA